jgi:hypothetical protein
MATLPLLLGFDTTRPEAHREQPGIGAERQPDDVAGRPGERPATTAARHMRTFD